MRQVRVQGCLPTLLALVVVAALAAVAVTAGLAVVLVTAGLLAAAAVVGFLRRLLGGGAPPPGPGGVEAVPPGWMDREGGPVVEAEPRTAAPDGAGPIGDGERTLPPRG